MKIEVLGTGCAKCTTLYDNVKQALAAMNTPEAARLQQIADYLVRKNVWIVGGDGWAYDIGYGGLDHVLNANRDVNILVLDTEVYSNTGGQASKATPTGAAAKFASAGKEVGKKDIGLMAMAYGHVYVARVAFRYPEDENSQKWKHRSQPRKNSHPNRRSNSL